MTTTSNDGRCQVLGYVRTNFCRNIFEKSSFSSNLRFQFVAVIVVCLFGSLFPAAECRDASVVGKQSQKMNNFLSQLLEKHDEMYNIDSDPYFEIVNRMKRDVSDGKTDGQSDHYVASLFSNYGDENVLSVDNFDILLKKIGLKKMTKFANETDDHDHDDHDDHDHEDHDHDHDHDHEGHDDHDDHDHDHDHEGHDDHDHDHEDHDHDHDHEGHDIQKRDVDDGHKHNNDSNHDEKCMTSVQLLEKFGLGGKTELNVQEFSSLLPAVVFQLDSGVCKMHAHKHETHGASGTSDALIWVYTMISVTIISLCALFGILCIPRKDRPRDELIMQFLIATAMGSMSGDGMLHLIPHAMAPHSHGDEDHHDHGDEEETGHLDGMYKGLMALIGVYAFFFLERAFAAFRARKDAKTNEKRSSGHVPMIANGADGAVNRHADEDGYENSHGHSHVGMCECTSLAMMIIVGDMFHNFCDGLAIGAAFASSLTVGISTSIAVFCHELPHEIGDFAVLVKSGMSRPKAIAFNMLSTVPCFFGAAIGIKLGELGDFSLWIFALVGGMFMYIALVDLVPEMTRAYQNINGPIRCYMVLHCLGMFFGVIIMLIIGIYEEDLQRILT